MLHSPALEILLAAAGLVAGSAIVYLSPRLVEYRLPQEIPFPGLKVLIPIGGAWLEPWKPIFTAPLEILTAAVFAGLAWKFGASLKLLISALYCIILIAIAYIDLEHRLVLNRLSYPGVVLALALSPLWKGLGLRASLIGAAIGLVGFAVIQILGRGALGTGDTKLACLIGAMKGFPAVVNTLLLGVILGGVAGFILLVILRRGRKSFFAYAPYLAAGGIASFFLFST